MTKDNLDYIVFTIQQAKEAVDFGFTVNNCRRNLVQVIKPYLKHTYKDFPISLITDELMDGPLEKAFVEKTLTKERIDEIASSTPIKRSYNRPNRESFEFIIFALKQMQKAREKFPNQSQTENFTIAMVQHWEKEVMEENVQKKDSLTIKSVEAQKKLDEGLISDCIATYPIPKSVMIECLLDALPDKNKIENILKSSHFVMLITKEEKDKLSDAGLAQKMPDGWKCGDDPWARYKAVGIS